MLVGSYYAALLCVILFYDVQIVYILDQVRALENEMLQKLKQQGLDISPKILIVSIDLGCVFNYMQHSTTHMYYVYTK